MNLRSRTNKSPVMEWWRSVDHMIVLMFALLIISGIILSMAASPIAQKLCAAGNSHCFFKKHVFFATIGVAGAIFVSFLSVQNARRLGVLALIGGLAVMLTLPIIGHEVKGAARWIKIGSLSLQPSEFVKPGFIVFAAWMFSVRNKNPDFPGVLISFMIYFVLIFSLIRQPDFGQSFLLTLCFGAVFFYAGLSLRWMVVMGGATAIGSIAAYSFLPHVRDRLGRFLNPDKSDNYQTDKALEAIANGGVFGKGPGEGSVKYKVPDGHTDFIFAITVEEFGFVLSLGLIALLAIFVGRSFRNALHLNDHFSQLAVAGLATMIGLQAMINLAVNLNMIPPKGMTLPFISYGGSSMLALCFSAGLILSFTRKRPGAYSFGVH